MEALIKYIGEHNSPIVIGLVAVIIVTFLLIVFFYLRQKKQGPTAADISNIDSIEVALRRVLEDHDWQQQEMKVAPAPGGDKDSDSNRLMVQTLEQKIKTLQEQLQSKGDSAPTSNPQDEIEKQNLMEKLKELEAKLAEYAIIEDDIADLNAYKRENKTLKEELEKAKMGGVTTAAAVAATAAPSQPVVKTAPAAEPPVNDLFDNSNEQDNIFGEFEKVVKNQNANQAINEFSKKVNEEPPFVMEPEAPPQVKVVAPDTVVSNGQVQILETEDGASAYSDEVAKDTAKEAELFVKDFQGLFPAKE